MDEAQFNKPASAYSKDASRRGSRDKIFYPSLLKLIPSFTGKSVLDLACGDGSFSRVISKLNPSKVVAVDISKDQIDKAIELSGHQTVIKYINANACDIKHIDPFDIIIGNFFLHYAPSIDDLKKYCKHISLNLKPGGLFIGLNENPVKPIKDSKSFGVAVECVDGVVHDSCTIRRTHYDSEGNELFNFTHRHFHLNTYELSLRESGMYNVTWHKLRNMQHGDADDAMAKHWASYISQSTVSILSANKSLDDK
ncbi:class I SAM-dependent methyltransferase [Alkalimonas amylolytica]|uniref:Methyltransferase domain-containing protein n=1 Tax=Alkalimonas amylolytica TaxID=152573 RepID=A0A1H3YEU9_ALKAM|nr:class I SAM-dependent methyltransferase [Alkalimonas amylolytica]SEA10067.1 Methyltransferase domain-containing protein [Alkalimonas amylolytica]